MGKIMEPLNKKKAAKLFEEYAVLLGNCDCLPVFVAVRLFGADVVNRVKTAETIGSLWNAYGNGFYLLDYLTEKGFQTVVSYHNVSRMAQVEREAFEA